MVGVNVSLCHVMRYLCIFFWSAGLVSASFPVQTLGGQKLLLSHVSAPTPLPLCLALSRCFLWIGGRRRRLVSFEEVSHTTPEGHHARARVKGKTWLIQPVEQRLADLWDCNP